MEGSAISCLGRLKKRLHETRTRTQVKFDVLLAFLASVTKIADAPNGHVSSLSSKGQFFLKVTTKNEPIL